MKVQTESSSKKIKVCDALAKLAFVGSGFVCLVGVGLELSALTAIGLGGMMFFTLAIIFVRWWRWWQHE
jgi:hypothetical protein